ncbi:hypothetical protein [Methylibium petroleiphilum]|nr:hypothetical protein [Methylibium petroleiphilum]
MKAIPAAPAKPSAGLAFLTAARDGMPSTLGDRVRIQAMGEAMHLAVRCKFRFDKDDAGALKPFGIRTSVGVFRPMDENYYSAACVHGGTYARMWEAWADMKPWIAPRAIAGGYGSTRGDDLGENRVAPGVGVLLPLTEADAGADAGLSQTRDAQVWWCTSIEKNEIVLCRYRFPEGRRYPFDRDGQPARRMKLSRAQWAALFPVQKKQDEQAAEAVAA